VNEFEWNALINNGTKEQLKLELQELRNELFTLTRKERMIEKKQQEIVQALARITEAELK
jgi:hypothetical protein